jgi:excisionase family DNA binding protein
VCLFVTAAVGTPHTTNHEFQECITMNNTAVEPLLHSRREAAKMLGICPQTLDSLIRSGALPHTKISNLVKIRADVLRKFAAEGHTGRIRD